MHNFDVFYYSKKCGDKYKVIDCKTCGYKHLYPIPSQMELKAFYEQSYYQEIKGVKESAFPENASNWDFYYGHIENTAGELLKSGNPFHMLDIGCGYGKQLYYFKKKGWEVLGIEPSEALVEAVKAQGIPVISATYDEVDFSKIGFFDVVTINFVLEHVPNPRDLLQKAHAKLKPGGVLFLQSPNDFNQFQLTVEECYGKDKWWISAPDHINYFDFPSMEKLLSDIGFKVALKEAVFPVEMFLLFGDDYLSSREVSSEITTKKYRFEKALFDTGRVDLKRQLARKFAELNIGRSMMFYAVRVQ